MDQRTRKLMTIHKTLYPIDEVDRLYVSKNKGRRLASIQDSVDASIQRLEDYIQKRGGRLITASSKNTENTIINWIKITRKQKRRAKQLYWYLKRLTSEISIGKTWTWLRKGNLKKETESLQIVEQNNTIRTNYVNANIDTIQQNSKCRLCGDRDEVINHIILKDSKKRV